jgi:hypothetical protein
MKKKRMREEKANERREMGCEKNMEMKEEEADVRRRWKKRKKSRCDTPNLLK